MAFNFNKDQMKEARRTDLYNYLVLNHGERFKGESGSLRFLDDRSICIKEGYSGYIDWATMETGNSVDFLTRYLGYSTVDAVLSLTGGRASGAFRDVSASPRPLRTAEEEPQARTPVFPEKLDGTYKNLYAYLSSRGIQSITINGLIKAGLIYQEPFHNNIVFINKDRDWAELHGSYSYGNSFHGVVKDCRHDGFWAFSSGNPKKAYICEAAIDAISLYELNRLEGRNAAGIYISIGGVAKQSAIDRIKRIYAQTDCRPVLAVDNDRAGQECRDRNRGLDYIIPDGKDWNDDLRVRKQSNERARKR